MSAKKSPRAALASRIDGMRALDEMEDSTQESSFLSNLMFILSKDVDAAHKGMLQALRHMAEGYLWDSEAHFVFEVGKEHIAPIGGEFVQVFDEVLKGKRKAGSLAYRKKCARAYELWVEHLPAMRKAQQGAKEHLVGSLSAEEQKRLESLRHVFHAGTIENWIVERRSRMLTVAMPGEAGYSHVAHIRAMRKAIDAEFEKRLQDASEYANPDSENSEEMFMASMRTICAHHPDIAEAYRETLQRSRPNTSRSTGLSLVSSRD
ncbi:MAG TPA: hypothetical protein VJL61_06790 [Rhodanobacteraceae bacterium]|nr:hypothetical protein [Rhodanobacteraceae bacterium]